MKRRIVAVIVLYKMTAEASVSYKSLLQAAAQVPADSLDLAIHLHDNTEGAKPPENLPANVVYHTDGTNTGLANAYNRTLAIALDRGYEWLLTLDQDTVLPSGMLRALVDTTAQLSDQFDVAAIVPQIRASGRMVSPHTFIAGAWPRWFPAGYVGIPNSTVYAFNSGSLLRVSSLRQIGGYSPWFWLDSSDLFVYRQLAKYGKRVYVSGNVELDHDLSMLNMRNRVSPERYETMLMAESAFWDVERNSFAGAERTVRLAARLVRERLGGGNPELHRLTLRALALRLFRSRRYRIERWRRATQRRLGVALNGLQQSGRPMVSVCMASYNGQQYIKAQLLSVVHQLGAGDEIVIVDDCSSDGAVERIHQMRAEAEKDAWLPRILFVQHHVNQGVVRTFEDAIRMASGDIIFLCDNDDLWAPDKVRKVLDAFATNPRIRIVATGVTLIGEQDKPLDDPAYNYLKGRAFTTNVFANLLRNHYQGSAMAFRSSLIRCMLPLPAGRLFLHDAWMGLRNTLSGGKVAYIDEPLLLYRRHVANYSCRFSKWKQLRLRQQLITALLSRAFQRL